MPAPRNPIAHSAPETGADAAALGRLLGASAAMRRCDDPDRVLDVLVTTMSMLVPGHSLWAGWKSPGAPLGHVTVSDPVARSGPAAAPAAALETALERWAERLATGAPPFQVGAEDGPFGDRPGAAPDLVAFPMSSASRVGALVVSGRLAELADEVTLIGLLCDQAAASLELVSARGTGRRAEAVSETLTQLTASYLDPDVILQTIVRSAAGLLDADAAYVMLADEEGRRLRVRTAHGIASEVFFEPTFSVDELFVGDAIRERRVICVRDVQAHAESVNSRTEGLRTTICAPMFADDELVGVLLAANREVRERSPDDRRIITALASAAAVAITNSRLHVEREGSLAALGEVNELLDQRSQAGERTLDFQRRLTSLVLEGGGLEGVVATMTAALGRRVVVLDRELVVLHDAGPGAGSEAEPLREAVAAFRRRGGSAQRRIEAGAPLVAPLEIAGERSAYVVVLAGEAALEGAEMAMTEAGVTAIGLELMRDRANAEAEARLTGGLFQALLSEGEVDEAAIARRASFLGYEFSGANAVIAVRSDESGGEGLSRRLSLETCVQRVVRRTRDVPTAVFEREETIFVVLSDPDEVPVEVLEEHTALIRQELAVSGRSRGVRIAHAGSHRGIAGLRRAAEEATYALHVLGILGREGKPQAFRDLGIWTLLGSIGDPRSLTAFADGVLGDLLEHDAERQTHLVETLRALVACNFHYRTAADELFAHPNTLRYRMSRITELTGLDFADADDRLRVELALRILDLGKTG